jgi:hypothetical protein
LHPRPREWRQRGCHKNCGHIVYARCAGRNLHAHSLQHVGQSLDGENGLPAVTRALQAHHNPVAHQRVVAYAFDGRDVPNESFLTFLLGQRSGEGDSDAQRENNNGSTIHRNS